MKRLLVAGGGTGGHVTPLLAVLEALREEDGQQAVEVHYLGRSGSIEERLARAQGLAFHPIASGAVRGLAPWRVATNVGKLAAGLAAGLREVRRFEPDAVLVTGGYVSVPVALAGWLARRPVVVCLPDMEPGLAVRLLARLATRVTVSFEEVRATLPAGKTAVTGYPVRQALLRGERAGARRRLGIADNEAALLVLGGSSGSRSINDAVFNALPGLLPLAQVLHLTGTLGYERVRAGWQGLDACARGRYRIYSYVEDEIVDLLWAADLAVARAGAATLGEFPAAGLPSILVPGRFAGGHQALNATYLKDRGAALVIEDAGLEERLLPTVRALIQDPERLAGMAAAARRLARPLACRAIVAELQRAANRRPM